ncbi:CHAD domain-containing protein [Pseudarthrobacter oxydans]|uniref:CYTH and CHAD domain-containing protein n=1 Tax=Pseudarthrobacter oxydans TaxID=1671 RepID=UPI00278444D3|nr:CYTH and CHAD domain-containing protein [Pseudarthrobacter oxydans]MDP9984744.1 CHAD domain-containing protein [Pseudarthrobacter oxydans]
MAATRVVEIERKFDVEEAVPLPSPQNLPGVARVDRPVAHRLETEYFDTEDLRLASARITLRRRTGGEDAGWHLKLPAGVDERTEFREPLGEQADGVPDFLLGLVRVHTRDRALLPVARLKTRRVVYRLRDENNAVLAEFCDDRVQSETLGQKPGTLWWREWEIELVSGSRTLLESLQDRLAGTGVRPSAYQSKLARALKQDSAPVEPIPAPKRKGPAGDVLLAYLRQQVKELKEQDPLVRQDAPDAVHKMRVATRRMRSALATYRKLLDNAESVGSLRDELKWLAGVLGEARDAEVMHARLKDMVAEEPGELVMGPVSRRVDLELGRAYQQAHATALEALDGKRYFRLLDALEAMIAAPPLAPLASKPAAKVIPDMVQRDVKRLRMAVGEAKRHPAGTGDHPALHEARKDGKRLRYAAEAAAPVNPKQAARLAAAAQGVQKVLGDHQDSVVTRELLRRLGAEAFVLGENGFSYGRLHALEQAVALEAEARFHREWKKFPAVPL